MNGRVVLLKPAHARPRIKEVEQITSHRRMIVWWHGGVKKNNTAQSVPRVVVFFREIDDQANVGCFIGIQLALTHLGLLRIGTVWERGICVAEMKFEVEVFDLNFNKEAWVFSSPSEDKHLISMKDYNLLYPRDKNWLVNFSIEEGKNVLIPCSEIFTRLYGRSQEIKRVLATYPWKDAYSRIFSHQEQTDQETKGVWFVKLKQRMVNSDVVLAAHIKYDQYAQNAAKKVFSQVESGFEGGKSTAFLKISPWFEGTSRVRLKGFWINNGRTFLALRLEGCTEPQGVPILRDRDNTNQIEHLATGGDEGIGWAGTKTRLMLKGQEIIDLTDAQEPDHGAETLELEDDDLELIGKPRIVYDQKRGNVRETPAKPPRPSEQLDTFSTGEAFGSGKGVGWASIHAPVVMESQGMLRDMWNAMLYAMRVYPELIQRVEWFTFDEDFCPALEPKLIPLQPFDEHGSKGNDIRNWVYYDVQHQVPRGVLVARLTIGQRHVFVLEIQRRPRANEGESKVSEEAFQGLVFLLRKPSDFEASLRSLLSDIRSVKGVVKRLEAGFQGDAHAFKHSASRDEKVPGEAALWNALGKVGVKMPMQSGVEMADQAGGSKE